MNRAATARSTIVAITDQVSCETNGEAVILHLASGVYYGLNPVGAWVWQFVQTPRTVGEILRGVLDKYEVEAGRCEQDLHVLLDKLAAAALIEVRPPSPD
jgi:hypothetical protein